MRFSAYVATGFVLLALILLTLFSGEDNVHDTRDFKDASGEISGVELSLEVVSSPEERLLGLSNLQSLEEDQGMLFVFNEPRILSFWMKDMNFPIDIIWLDSGLAVVDVSFNLSPDSYRSSLDAEYFSPSVPAQYALEVVAGFAERHEIKTGDVLRIEGDTLNSIEG